MVLWKTRKSFPSGRGKKCKPLWIICTKRRATAFVGCGRNNFIDASSWFLFNQTRLLSEINQTLTKAWLMMHHANRQHSGREVPISDNGWLWAMMQILVFHQAKAADSPHYWHSEPKTSQTETSHTWAKNTTADNTLHKYELHQICVWLLPFIA